MRRRNFLALGSGAALGLIHRASAMPVPFQDEKSKLKITGVRLVHTRPKRPVVAYEAAAGSWSTGGVEVANPMSIYPEYKAQRSLFMPDHGKLLFPHIGHYFRQGRLVIADGFSSAYFLPGADHGGTIPFMRA